MGPSNVQCIGGFWPISCEGSSKDRSPAGNISENIKHYDFKLCFKPKSVIKQKTLLEVVIEVKVKLTFKTFLSDILC